MKSTIILFLVLSFWTSIVSEYRIQNAQVDQTKVGVQIINTCTQALIEAMPPTFCWKGKDALSVIPRNCPIGYTRHLALCFKDCRPGYIHFAGICKAPCEKGSFDMGFLCFRSLTNMYAKSIYIPRSITNFNPKVTCPKGYYRSGAFCYRNCHEINMENCGIGACSSDIYSCAMEIIRMVMDVIKGVLDLTTFIMSYGGSQTAIKTIKKITAHIDSLTEPIINESFKILKKVFNNKYKKFTLQTAKKLAKEALIEIGKIVIKDFKSEITKAATNSDELCDSVYSYVDDEFDEKESVTKDSVIDSIMNINLDDITGKCLSQKVDLLSCVKSIITTAKQFDPTGLLTIASTFLKPTCKEFPLINSNNNEAIEEDNIPYGCFRIYEEFYYKGRYKELCDNRYPTFMEQAMNDFTIKSIKLSSDAVYLFYSQAHYRGTSYPLGRGSSIPVIENILHPSKTASDKEQMEYFSNFCFHLESVIIMKDQCFYIEITYNNRYYTREICSNIIDWKLGIIDQNIIMVTDNVLKEKMDDEYDETKVDEYDVDTKINVTKETLKKHRLFDSFHDYYDITTTNPVPILTVNSIFDNRFTEIRIKTNELTKVELYEKAWYVGKKVELNEDQQHMNKKDLKLAGLSDITSIRIIYRYDAQGFLCDNEANTDVIIRQNEDEVECFSLDGINCIGKMESLIKCTEYINKNIQNVLPIKCGDQYKLTHSEIGYNIPGHWCVKGIKYFNLNPAILN